MKKCSICDEVILFNNSKSFLILEEKYDICDTCFIKYDRKKDVDKLKLIRNNKAFPKEKLIQLNEKIEFLQTEEQKAIELKKSLSKKCLRCGAEMVEHGTLEFQNGKRTLLAGDLVQYLSGSTIFNVLTCCECGYTEFYSLMPKKEFKE